jgi:hypothetical protein
MAARLLFIGLWTLADRDGRMEDRPKKIRAEVFPYDNCDCDPLLDELAQRKFIIRYSVDDAKYISIPNFTKHQSPHPKEKPSNIPCHEKQVTSRVITGQDTDKQVASKLPAETFHSLAHLNPDIMNPDILNPECGITQTQPRIGKTDSFQIPSPLDTPEFREAFSKWEAYLRERMDVNVTASGLEADLYELASHPVDDAIAIIQYTRHRKAKGLILNGDHRGPPARSSDGRHRRRVPSFEEGLLRD